MKQRNKGFTLVELLVVVAVFAIVGAAITGFILSSQKSYARGANEVDIQEEAQLVSNQIQDLIIDTSLGISYKYIVTKDDATITDYMNNDAGIITDGELTQKEVWIYNKDSYYRLLWNKESKKLYYEEHIKTDAGYQLADGMPEGGVILGEYVKEFSVDLSQVASARIVTLAMTFQKAENGVDYDVNKTISLRNDILTNKDQSDVYAAADIEVQPSPDDIRLSPTVSVLWPGTDTQTYVASLTCSRGGVPSQNVNWSVSGATSGGTSVTGGKLTIGLDEKGNSDGEFFVVASADGFNYDTSTAKALEKTSTVKLRLIKAIKIDKMNSELFTPGEKLNIGGTYTFEVFLSGSEIDGLPVSEWGGLTCSLVKGSENAKVTKVEYGKGSGAPKATVTLEINDVVTGTNPSVELKFTVNKPGFTDISASTGECMISDVAAGPTNLILEKSDGDANDWLRAQNQGVEVSYKNNSIRSKYENNSGTIKSNYYIRYIYELHNSSGEVVETFGWNNNGGDNSPNTSEGSYFDEGKKENYNYKVSNVELTKSVSSQSGSVWVTAQLYKSENGTTTLKETSNTVVYTIPEVKIVYSLCDSDNLSDYKANLNIFITPENREKIKVYYKFIEGVSASYKVNKGLFVWEASSGYADSKLSKKKPKDGYLEISGQEESKTSYASDMSQYVHVSYDGLTAQAATVYLVTTNFKDEIDDVDCDYIPAPMSGPSSDWVNAGGGIYYYYVNSSKRFRIKQNSANKYVATYEYKKSRDWNSKDNKVTYSSSNHRWE